VTSWLNKNVQTLEKQPLSLTFYATLAFIARALASNPSQAFDSIKEVAAAQQTERVFEFLSAFMATQSP